MGSKKSLFEGLSIVTPTGANAGLPPGITPYKSGWQVFVEGDIHRFSLAVYVTEERALQHALNFLYTSANAHRVVGHIRFTSEHHYSLYRSSKGEWRLSAILYDTALQRFKEKTFYVGSDHTVDRNKQKVIDRMTAMRQEGISHYFRDYKENIPIILPEEAIYGT